MLFVVVMGSLARKDMTPTLLSYTCSAFAAAYLHAYEFLLEKLRLERLQLDHKESYLRCGQGYDAWTKEANRLYRSPEEAQKMVKLR